MLCGLPCYVAVLASGDSLPRTMLRHLLPLLGVRAISIFYQFIQFLGATSDGEVERIFPFISSFHLLANPAKHPAGQLLCPPPSYLPSSSTPPPPPSGSRGGRPVSARLIGKQRPKMYFPVPSLLPTSKHSNRSRKSVAGPQFLLTMILSSSRRHVLLHENLTNLKIYDIIYLQGEGRKKNLHHHLHYA